MRQELQALHGDNRNLKKIEVIFKNIKTLKDENEKIINKTQIKADDLDRDMKDLIAQNQILYSDNIKLRNISEIWASMIKLQKENAAILKEIDMTRTTHGTEQSGKGYISEK